MATNVVKVARPGYSALTDTNPAHFSLFIDGSIDHILIKEKNRGVEEVGSASTEAIQHDLNYYPMTIGMVESASEQYQWVYNAFGGAFNPFYMYVTDMQLMLGNEDGSSRDFAYIILLDQI